MNQTLRVVIADDMASARAALKAVLANFPPIEVVADARDGIEAIEQVKQHHPDVVLMDARMPVMDGLEATRIIKQYWPQTRVVLLSMYATEKQATAAGADSFLLKGMPIGQLLDEVGYVQDNLDSTRPV